MMNPKKTRRITWLLLLLGLGSALAIYLTAAPEVTDPLLGDRFANKKYLREMRMLGGQANVLADQFQDWFGGLWHGRALAGTVALLTVGTVLVFRFVAMHPGTETPEDTPPEACPVIRVKGSVDPSPAGLIPPRGEVI